MRPKPDDLIVNLFRETKPKSLSGCTCLECEHYTMRINVEQEVGIFCNAFEPKLCEADSHHCPFNEVPYWEEQGWGFPDSFKGEVNSDGC